MFDHSSYISLIEFNNFIGSKETGKKYHCCLQFISHSCKFLRFTVMTELCTTFNSLVSIPWSSGFKCFSKNWKDNEETISALMSFVTVHWLSLSSWFHYRALLNSIYHARNKNLCIWLLNWWNCYNHVLENICPISLNRNPEWFTMLSGVTLAENSLW
jgi:hypothetical protein